MNYSLLAGLVYVSRTGSLNYTTAGKDIEMDAILAVALGGNSLAGGKFNVWAIINAKIKCTPNIIKIAVGITVKATFKVASLQFMILIPCRIQADRKIIKPKRHNSPNQVLCNFLGRCFLCFLKSNVIYCI